MCLKVTRLHAQHLSTILDSKVNTILEEEGGHGYEEEQQQLRSPEDAGVNKVYLHRTS